MRDALLILSIPFIGILGGFLLVELDLWVGRLKARREPNQHKKGKL